MLDQARTLLTSTINEKGASSFELANYGLLEGLSGRPDEAERYWQVADWWAQGNHAHAVIAFNRATLMFSTGEDDVGKNYLAEALKLSKRDIGSYCGVSDYVQEAAARNIFIKDMIQGITGSGRARPAIAPDRATSDTSVVS